MLTCAEQAASGVDIGTFGVSDGSGEAALVKHLREVLYAARRGSGVRRVGYGVIGYDVDAARQAAQQETQLVGMARRIVEVVEECVFEGQSSLTGPVVTPEQCYGLLYGMCLFYGHKFCALRVERRMEAHGEVRLALVEELFDGGGNTDGGYRDAPRTQCKTPPGCEYVYGLEHRIEVVHRFAHAHKDDVSDSVGLLYGDELVEYLAGSERAAVAHAAGHAEATAHATADLRRHTQRATVGIGYVGCLDGTLSGAEEIFACAVGAAPDALEWAATDGVLHVEFLPECFGDVGHSVDGVDPFGIEPLCYLLRGVARCAERCREVLQLVQCEAEEQ